MTDSNSTDQTEMSTTATRELTVTQAVEAPPERVYEAFLDADELGRWMHPPGFTAEVDHFEAEEGGTYRITMRGDTEEMTDRGHSYGGTFEELVPAESIVQTETFESEEAGMDGEMTVTTTFDEVTDGTDVTVRLEIPEPWPDGAIGGWEAALGNLATMLQDE